MLLRLLALLLALAGLPLAADSDLPPVPGPVREAMVDGRFDDAVAELERLERDAPEQVDAWQYLRATALRSAGRGAEAIALLELLEAGHPESAWLHKARFARAELLRGERRYEEAEAIYEAEAQRLLSPERKRELAGVYLRFADELSDDDDDGPGGAAPDYARAYELYRRVLELGAPAASREEALFRMGWCKERLGSFGEAVRDYAAYLAEFGDSEATGSVRPRVFEVRLALARTRLASDDRTGARRAYEDLLADIERARGDAVAWGALDAEAVATIEGYEGDASYGIGRTWRGDAVHEAPLAVAARERFVERFPAHPRAWDAAFEVGHIWKEIGRYEDAIAGYDAFLARASSAPGDARSEELTRFVMSAVFAKARVRGVQKRFDDAIALYSEYVRTFPSGPRWADAQQAIIDTEYAVGVEHRDRGEFAEARAAWEAFVGEHPLDGRARSLLYDLGDLYVREADALDGTAGDELRRTAIAAWERLVEKYPGTDEASRALLSIGLLYESKLGELQRAIDTYKRCNFGSSAGAARGRLSEMTRPSLSVLTERVYRTNEPALVHLHVRNLEKVQVELFRIDLEAYFRKHLTHRSIEALDLDLIAADRTLEVAIDDYEPWKPIEQALEIPMEGPGVWAVTVTADDERATTLALRSDVDVVVKSSRRELFVFAQDMVSGSPATGVRVLAGLPGMGEAGTSPRVVEAETDGDGVARLALDDLERAGDVRVLVLRDGHFASEGVALGGLGLASGLSPRGFVYTDRPVYRPGHRVGLRAIVRDVEDGSYAFTPGEAWRIEVADSQGRIVHREETALSEFGTLSGSLDLDEYVPTGRYTIACSTPNGPRFQGGFDVERYRLKPIEVTLETERDVYYRGESVEVAVRAAWYYGEPVAEAPLRYRLPDGKTGELRTDAGGEARFEFDTRSFPSEGQLAFQVDLLEEGVSQAGAVWLALHGFSAGVSTPRDVYLAGDAFEVSVSTRAPGGEPVSRPLRLSVLRRESLGNGQWGEVGVEELELETDADGRATRSLSIASGGHYLLRVEGSDRFGNPVVATTALFVSGEEDEVELRMITDTQRLEVGETARVDVINRAGPGLALLTFEGEEVFDYLLVSLEEGSNEIRFPVDHPHFPNFALSASMMRGNRFHSAGVEFAVARRLNVAIAPERENYAPGERAAIGVHVTDQLGRPVVAELSLAVVDAALYEQFPDRLPDVTAYFQEGARRHAALRTSSSCTFRYDGVTVQIADAILEELQREKALGEWEESREALRVALSALEEQELDADAFAGFDARFRELAAATEPMPQADAKQEFNDVIGLGGGSGGKFGGRAGGRRKQTSDGSSALLAGDTAFWTPALATDAEGRGQVEFELPDHSTRWRVSAHGTTADTVLGEGEGSFVTRAEFFVELKSTGVLTEGTSRASSRGSTT